MEIERDEKLGAHYATSITDHQILMSSWRRKLCIYTEMKWSNLDILLNFLLNSTSPDNKVSQKIVFTSRSSFVTNDDDAGVDLI